VQEAGDGNKAVRGNLNPWILCLMNSSADGIGAEFFQEQLVDLGKSHGSSRQKKMLAVGVEASADAGE
jgi:hypothetical protein